MNILAVDDERLVLKSLTHEIKKVFPKAKILEAMEWQDAIDIIDSSNQNASPIEYAFLDIRLGGTNGIDLAKTIKDRSPDTKILFCTAYNEYALHAFHAHAMGYLLKPVNAESIIETLDAMDKDWKSTENNMRKDVKVQTFGNFEVFVDGKMLSFEREKAKELLAYLVDRRGSSITTAQIAAILWEDKPYNKSLKSQATVVISSLKRTLKQEDIEMILIKTWNHLAIDTGKIQCDVYDFYEGDSIAINSYKGEYMANYSWAEFSNASLTEMSN